MHPVCMKFSDLLQSKLAMNPAEQQREAAKLFPVAVKSSNFKLWTAKNYQLEMRSRFVIGVATYVPVELALLDRINEKLSKDSGSMAVEVFNFLDCANQKDLDIRVPGIVRVYQTPIVGFWKGHEFRQSEQGVKARKLLCQLFD
jgi:hypothetical protein